MDVSILTAGAIQAFLDGNGPPRPKLQILGIKKLISEGSTSTTERFKLQISDGVTFQPGMLTTQLNKLVHRDELDKNCIIQVEKMTCNTVSGRKIIILVNITVLHRGMVVGKRLGEPKALEVGVANKINSYPQPPQRQTNQPFQSMHSAQNHGGGGRGGGWSGNQAGNPGQSKPFYGNSPAPPSQSSPMSGGGSLSGAPPTGMSPGGARRVCPIASLNPYQNKWTIRARVTSKPSLRHYSNSRGDGRVMSVELVDESGEIKASCFNEVADKMHPLLEANKVYYISRARLKPANKQFTSVKNDFEMTFTTETEISECFEATSSIPTLSFDFTNISDLEKAVKDTIVDVIGVCRSASDVTSITTRTTNRKVSKRDVSLVDKSSRTVSCTLWGTEAEEFDPTGNPVVAIKGVKVSDFNGVSLSVMGSSVISINPDIEQAHQLRGWYDNHGKNEEVSSLSTQGGGGNFTTTYLSLKQVKELDLGKKEKPDFFSFKGIVTFVRKENMLYKACPTAECQKKVNEDSSGTYFCEKCSQSFPNFKYRMILQVNVSDYSDSCWISCFSETASVILNCDAQQLGEMRDKDEPKFELVCEEANFKEYLFRVRAKVDTFNDEQRLRCMCSGAALINYSQETRRRLEDIKTLMSQ